MLIHRKNLTAAVINNTFQVESYRIKETRFAIRVQIRDEGNVIPRRA